MRQVLFIISWMNHQLNWLQLKQQVLELIVDTAAATTQLGKTGILHGSKSLLMQTEDGQVVEPHSISAGLDYPGIGPLHAHLFKSGRAKFLSATDDEAVEAAFELARLEGIIPALESAHALSALKQLELKNVINVVCLSGRGDKDLATYMKVMEK